MRPDVLKLLNGEGAVALVPTRPKRRAANEAQLILPGTGGVDTWWRIDVLFRRAAAQIPLSVNPVRRQVICRGIGRLPADEARALVALDTYRWYDGDHWASFVKLIVTDPGSVAVTLVDDARLMRLPEGAVVKPHLDSLLAWLTEQAKDRG